MALLLTNGTGGGNWADTTTWAGGAVPVTGVDTAQIENTDNIDVVPLGATCTTNNGAVAINNGTIITNNNDVNTNSVTGVITTNNLTVENNYGLISTNEVNGYIPGGDGANSGMITVNNGEIAVNNIDGVVVTNNNKVNHNNNGGLVHLNAATGSISNGNSGIVEINDGLIVESFPDGVINTNNGIININDGIVGINSATGIIGENTNGAVVNANYGTVSNNDNYAIVNQFATGTMASNLGTVYLMELGATGFGTSVQIHPTAFSDPTEADVKNGTTYRFNSLTKTGTLVSGGGNGGSGIGFLAGI